MLAAKATRESVKHAARSVEVAANIERPYIFVREMELKPGPRLGEFESLWPAIILTNYGRTPARVLEIGFAYFLGRGEDIPEKPVYMTKADTTRIGVVLKEGDSHEFKTVGGISISVEQRRALSGFEVFQWIWGYIRYRDIFGGVSDVGFIARHLEEERIPPPHNTLISPAGFTLTGPPQYTYEDYWPKD
jgi:hypothetical protein